MHPSRPHFSLFKELLPNELVWGWLGRFRERYRGLSNEGIGEIIGEVPTYRKAFPTRLASLAKVASMDKAELLNQHTFFPFAAWELSQTEATALSASLLNSNAPVMIPRRFMPPEGFTLRVCRQCVEADLQAIGTSYYRCIHQLQDVLVCPQHGCGLTATRMPIGTRNYIPPHDALKEGKSLSCQGRAATIVAHAYAYVLKVNPCGRDQTASLLERILAAHGYLRSGRVDDKLWEQIERAHEHGSLRDLGLSHHRSVEDWVTVPHLALVCSTLNIALGEFLHAASEVRPGISRPSVLTAHQQELLERVKADAPHAARDLRLAGRKVTVWALATKLSERYDMNFASHYAWRPVFRTALLAHTKAS